MRREVLRWQQVMLEQWLIEEPTWGEEWVDAAASSDHLLRLTAEELRSLREEYNALAARYEAAFDDEQPRERVVVFFHAMPVRQLFP